MQLARLTISTLWEAFKAYMRGSVISRVLYDKELRSFTLTNFMVRIIQILENQYTHAPSPALYKEKLLLKIESSALAILKKWS